MHDLPSKISGGADVRRKMRRRDTKENMSLKRKHNQKLQQTGQIADNDSNYLL